MPSYASYQKKAEHATLMTQQRAIVQPKLTVNTPNDRYEQEADAVAERVMGMPSPSVSNTAVPYAKLAISTVQRKELNSSEIDTAPQSVHQTLSNSSGNALDKTTQNFMESRFDSNFNNVRVHTGEQAAASAREINARAYTFGNDIVFGKGEYQPNTEGGKRLLAHELVHVGQQNGVVKRQVIQGGATTSGTTSVVAPRPEVVYVMGNDGFYRAATRFFRARHPNATFVTNIHHLDGLLTHLNNTFNAPLGNIFIVSHANEDGTLAFGLNAADRDRHLTVVELRNALHPTSGGTSSLPSVANLIDENTQIRIKGCDLGRNQEVVELFDEAFGGQGRVTAPTHEQGYSFNTGDIRQARDRAMTEHLHEFEQSLPAIPPAPSRVDSSLRGTERRDATQAFREATRARTRAQAAHRASIQAERRSFSSQATLLGEIGGTHEFLSGPMFQRTGTTLFTDIEIRPQVDSLYPHLSDVQRASLVSRLIAPDRRAVGIAQRQGTYQQSGQRAFRYESVFTYSDPITEGQIRNAFSSFFRRGHFALDSFTMREVVNGEVTTRHYDMVGHDNRRGRQAQGLTYTAEGAGVDSNQSLLNRVRIQVNNPEKYSWRVDESRANSGVLTKKVIRERVVAYLHHGSLDASPTQRFTMPETDTRFFARSTFAPPVP